MTWEELVEKAKELGWEHKKTAYTKSLFLLNEDYVNIQFYPEGEIMVDETIISQNRTPEQMYQIMLALR
jgi:hypothetical protein